MQSSKGRNDNDKNIRILAIKSRKIVTTTKSVKFVAKKLLVVSTKGLIKHIKQNGSE